MDMVNSIGKTEKDMQVTIMIYYNQDIMLMTEKKDLEFIIGQTLIIEPIQDFGKMVNKTEQESILIKAIPDLDFGQVAKEQNGFQLIRKHQKI